MIVPKLVPLILISNILHLSLSFLASYLPLYSLQPHLIKEQFATFANFDGYHYLHNLYTHEPNFAFLPGFTLICQLFGSITALVILNKILFAFSAGEFYQICQLLKLSQAQKKRAILLFIFNPASVFFHSVYTESLYSFLTFRAIKLYLKHQKVLAPTFYLCLSILVRSTAMFLLPVIGLEILENFLSNVFKFNNKKAFNQLIKGISVLGAVLLPFILYLFWAHSRLCGSGECKDFFNVYSFVQEKHWNVDFLTYYKPQNLVFICLGSPAIIFAFISLRKMKFTKHQKGLSLSFCFLFLVITFYTNIQSSTRFLCTHPLFYILQSKETNKVLRFWHTSYYLLGMVLFTVGFPWT